MTKNVIGPVVGFFLLVSGTLAQAAALDCELATRTEGMGGTLIGDGVRSIRFPFASPADSVARCFVEDPASALPGTFLSELNLQGFTLESGQGKADPNVGVVACFKALDQDRVEVSLFGLWKGDGEIQATDRQVFGREGTDGTYPPLAFALYPSDFDRAFSSVSLICFP
jgi:hypothetical protein